MVEYSRSVPPPKILVAVREDAARLRVEAACRLAGGEAVAAPVDWWEVDIGFPPTAIVYDGLPFSESIKRIKRFRERGWIGTVITYPPQRSGVAPFLVECGKLPDVKARSQMHDAEDTEVLVSLLQGSMITEPERIVIQFVFAIVPDASESVQRFTRHVLRRRATGRRCTLELLASDLGLSSSSFWRRVAGKLPLEPKLTVDWLTALYVARLRSRYGLSAERVAGVMGASANTLHRLWVRLSIVRRSDDEWTDCALAFAVRCGVAEPDARVALDRVS